METYNQLLRAEYIKYWETKKRKRLNDGELWGGVGAVWSLLVSVPELNFKRKSPNTYRLYSLT